MYSQYILCRTLDVWQDISLKLPGISGLCWRPPTENVPKMGIWQGTNRNWKKNGRSYPVCFNGDIKSGITLPESKASTRHSDIESVEVLLIKKQRQVVDGILLRLLDDSELLLPKSVNAAERRKIASVILRNTLIAPVYCAPVALTKQIEWLRDYVYLGDYAESPFRAAVVLESDEVQGIGGSVANEKYNISYDSSLGYSVKKKGGSKDDFDE